MYPTVGRTVHYTPPDDGDVLFPPWAAIIVEVNGIPATDHHKHPCHEGCASVSLNIFYRTGQKWIDGVPWSDKAKRGHWSWPPRVG